MPTGQANAFRQDLERWSGVLLAGSMALRARRAPVISGREEMVGALGEVTQNVNGQVWARIHGENWQVGADVPLQPGQRVRVVELTGLILKVKPEPAEAVTP